MTFGGSYVASGQHGGLDFNGAALTGKRQITRQTTVETSGAPGKKRRVTLRTSKQVANLKDSANRHEVAVYDSHLLANQGPQRLVGLSMKVGTRLGKVDHYGPFLKLLNQSGRVTTSWNGVLESDIDERHVSMQVFRHQFSGPESGGQDGNAFEAPYPQVAQTYPVASTDLKQPHILYPQSKTQAVAGQVSGVVGGESLLNNPPLADKPVTGDLIIQPFYPHFTGQVSYCPINLPDLEDMSWNLNHLKITADNTQNPAGATIPALQVQPSFANNVAKYQVNMHRRQSQIRQHNYTSTLRSALSATVGSQFTPSGEDQVAQFTLPYKLNACLKYGKIAYEFMNKNDTGATVEVIVYRVKKTANLDGTVASYQNYQDTSSSNLPGFYPLNVLASAVAQGYVNTVGASYATENFQGRQPEFNDIYANPSYPLLPNLRKTVDSTMPFVEVMRNKFAMSAGSRRSLSIDLPGKLYDPSSKAKINQSVVLDPTAIIPINQVPIIDEDAYCVVLAVNGQKMTRFFDSKVKSGGLSNVILTFRQNAPAGAVGTKYYLNPAIFPVANTYNIILPSPGGLPAIIQLTAINDGTTPGAYPAWVCHYLAEDMVLIEGGSGFAAASTLPLYTDASTTLRVRDATGVVTYPVTVLVQTVTPLSVAALPAELPMGDNHGSALVDYCATYTEHLGACVYKDVGERNLYDCGQPVAPSLDPTQAAITKSSLGSRQILPATSVVRQAQRVGYTLDVSGNPERVTIEASTMTSGVPADGN